MLRIAVDIGGTFTDFVISDDHALRFLKLPSTPEQPASALIAGFNSYVRDNENVELLHGSTVATNALLENKISKTAFVTSVGFKDILHLGRQTRADLYSLEPSQLNCPIGRESCYGIDVLDSLIDVPDLGQYEAIAVCLINSYKFSYQENVVSEVIHRSAPSSVFISRSCDVSPEFREYERAMASVINACVGPVMLRYLKFILGETSINKLSIMSSAGGHIDFEEAVQKPILTITSGPAAGVAAAVRLARNYASGKAITLDIGGTSTDICLIDDEPLTTDVSEIAGLAARVRRIDVSTIGCGGGSIAHIDAVGALRVGPQSAGAVPGPALYGKGGPCTLTDANIVANRLVVEGFGSKISANIEYSQKAVSIISDRLDSSPESTAELIIELANAQMGRAIRMVSSLRGYTPSDFTLIAYGGAGGLHVCSVANEIGVERILIPVRPGLFSAYGLLCAPYIRECSKTVFGYGRKDVWDEVFSDLVSSIKFDYDNFYRKFYAGFRYKGQSYEIYVDASGTYDDAITRFHREHKRIYSFEKSDREVEWVSAHVRYEAPQEEIVSKEYKQPYVELSSRLVESLWQGRRIATQVCLREEISQSGEGPLIIVQSDSSTYVAPGWFWNVLDDGVLEIIKDG